MVFNNAGICNAKSCRVDYMESVEVYMTHTLKENTEILAADLQRSYNIYFLR